MGHRNGVTESEIEKETFHKYVQPGNGAIWDERACSIHRLSKDDDRIVNADEIDVAWKEICKLIGYNIDHD